MRRRIASIDVEKTRRTRAAVSPVLVSVTITMEDGEHEIRHLPVSCAQKLKQEKDAYLGMEPSVFFDRLTELLKEDARQRSYSILSRREHSVFELKEKLQRYPYHHEVIREIIEECQHQGYVDDYRFADLFIRSKLNAGWGRHRIDHELSLRGIDVQSIEGYPDAYYDGDDEYERAMTLLARKRIPEHNAYQKLFRFLYGRGYNADVARRAIIARLEDPED